MEYPPADSHDAQSSYQCHMCGKATMQCADFEACTVPLCSTACLEDAHAKLQVATENNGGALLVGCSATSHADLTITDSEINFRRTMDRLWYEHVWYIREFISVSLVDGDKRGLASAQKRLLQSPTDISNALRPFIGNAAGAIVRDLLVEHINGAARVVNAARSGTGLDMALAAWDTNIVKLRDQLNAAQLARAIVVRRTRNTRNAWCQMKLLAMLRAHLKAVYAMAGAQIYDANRGVATSTASIEKFDAVVSQAQAMSAVLAGGFYYLWPETVRKLF